MWWNLYKNSNIWGFRELWSGWTHPYTRKVMHPDSSGKETPVLRDLLDFALCVASSWHSSASFITSFNKLVNISVSQFCELLKQIKKKKQGRSRGNLGFVAKLDRSCQKAGNPVHEIGIWNKGMYHGTEPLTYGIWCSLWVDSVRIELSFKTPKRVLQKIAFCETES